MAKEVKLKMTLDEKGAVQSVEKVGERFKRMGRSGRQGGAAGHAGFLKIAAGAAAAIGAIQLVQGAFRGLNRFLSDSITKTAQTQDEIAKLSHKIGVSTGTLSAYRLATQLSGTSMESLATGFRMTAKNAYDFSNGTGEAKDSFEELGIVVTNENGKLRDAEEIMLDVADKLMLLEDSSRRTAIAQRIFGRSGTDLLPMLEKGRAGVEAMKEEARALGIVFSDETAAKSEEYNDSILRMNMALEGLKMRIGNAVIPALTQVLQAVMKNDDLMDAMARTAEFAGKVLKSTIWVIAKAGETYANFYTRVYNTLSLFKVFDKQYEERAKTSKAWADTFRSIADGIKDLDLTVEKTTKTTQNFNAEIDNTADSANKAASAIDLWNQALLNTAHHETLDVRAQLPAGPGLEGVFGNLDAAEEEARKKQEQLERLTSGFESGSLLPISPEIMTEGENPTVRFAEETVGALDMMKSSVLEFGQAGAQAFGQWATGQASMGTALRQASVQVLANLGSQAFALALMETGLGIAALTPWGRAVYGDPTKHFLAAAKFGALAGVAGGIARSMSGGEGGMGSPGSAANPVYIQPSYQGQNQQIVMEQSSAIHEFKEALGLFRTQSAGVVVKEGVGENRGVVALMNDYDKKAAPQEIFQMRYARE